jgi:hypothetical protein
MRDTQIGLLVVTPMIVGMAFLLRRKGALSLAGALGLSGAAILAASVLFFSH